MTVRVLLVSFGSLGDVLPFVGTALDLTARGHDVTVAVPDEMTTWIRRLRVDTAAVGTQPSRRVMRAFASSLGADDGEEAFVRYWRDLVLAGTDAKCGQLQPLVDRADVIVAHQHHIAAHVTASIVGRPIVKLAFSPACVRSAAYPSSRHAMRRLADVSSSADDPTVEASWDHELSWAIEQLDEETNALLATYGLPPVEAGPFSLSLAADTPIIACSPVLHPPGPDWPEAVRSVAYPRFDRLPTPASARLEEFIAEDDPPVLVSFGSAVSPAMSRLYQEVTEAVLVSGRRAIVVGHVAGVAATRRVLRLQYAPFEDVVPSCGLVVHHGGAGITDSAARAGVPSVVIPQFADQPLNAHAVVRAGAGVAVHPRSVDRGSALLALEAASALVEARSLHDVAVEMAREPPPWEALAEAIETTARAPSRPT